MEEIFCDLSMGNEGEVERKGGRWTISPYYRPRHRRYTLAPWNSNRILIAGTYHFTFLTFSELPSFGGHSRGLKDIRSTLCSFFI